jgi:hypothetical protein
MWRRARAQLLWDLTSDVEMRAQGLQCVTRGASVTCVLMETVLRHDVPGT